LGNSKKKECLIDFGNVDWALLRKQKEYLFNEVLAAKGEQQEILNGVVCFLDHIMDSAVESGAFTDEEVFGILK